MALGDYESAYQSFRRAYEIQADVEAISRELAGVCLELGRFDEAVEVARSSAGLAPDNAEVLGNLSVALLMAGDMDLARKSIDAAIRIDPGDQINKNVKRIIGQVASGKRPAPSKLSDLTKPIPRKKPFWKFW